MRRRPVLALLLLLMAGFALPGPVLAARQDYCRAGTGTTALLVDRTTQYDQQDVDILVAGLDRFVGELKAGDRLIVHTITDNPAASARMFSDCVPGCPETGGLTAWIMSSCKPTVAKADNREFRKRLAQVLVGMLREKQAYAHSEILRTIDNVTRTYRPQGLSRLIVFSDLLEHSEVLSFAALSEQPPARNLRSVAGQQLLPPLAGVEVEMFGFGRNHTPDRKALPRPMENRIREFWTLYLRDSGAGPSHIGLWYAGTEGAAKE